jgi:hypothetical protein
MEKYGGSGTYKSTTNCELSRTKQVQNVTELKKQCEEWRKDWGLLKFGVIYLRDKDQGHCIVCERVEHHFFRDFGSHTRQRVGADWVFRDYQNRDRNTLQCEEDVSRYSAELCVFMLSAPGATEHNWLSMYGGWYFLLLIHVY